MMNYDQIDCFLPARPYTMYSAGGELDSTWVAKLRVHAEGQITSLNQL